MGVYMTTSNEGGAVAPQQLAERERIAFTIFLAGSAILIIATLWIGWSSYSAGFIRVRDDVWIIGGSGWGLQLTFTLVATAAVLSLYFSRRSARDIELCLAARIRDQVARARAGDAAALDAHREVWPIFLDIAWRWWWVRFFGWLLWIPLIVLFGLAVGALWSQPPETEMRGVALAVLGAFLIASLLRFLWVDHPGPKPGPR